MTTCQWKVVQIKSPKPRPSLANASYQWQVVQVKVDALSMARCQWQAVQVVQVKTSRPSQEILPKSRQVEASRPNQGKSSMAGQGVNGKASRPSRGRCSPVAS